MAVKQTGWATWSVVAIIAVVAITIVLVVRGGIADVEYQQGKSGTLRVHVETDGRRVPPGHESNAASSRRRPRQMAERGIQN
jgi:hypothetical protein